jgi:hypothetical protein
LPGKSRVPGGYASGGGPLFCVGTARRLHSRAQAATAGPSETEIDAGNANLRRDRPGTEGNASRDERNYTMPQASMQIECFETPALPPSQSHPLWHMVCRNGLSTITCKHTPVKHDTQGPHGCCKSEAAWVRCTCDASSPRVAPMPGDLAAAIACLFCHLLSSRHRARLAALPLIQESVLHNCTLCDSMRANSLIAAKGMSVYGS